MAAMGVVRRRGASMAKLDLPNDRHLKTWLPFKTTYSMDACEVKALANTRANHVSDIREFMNELNKVYRIPSSTYAAPFVYAEAGFADFWNEQFAPKQKRIYIKGYKMKAQVARAVKQYRNESESL